ncbi:MAG: DNA polymerase I [Planctomycetes bacterium]|nr:DNA polymerase I [Planctomycetota bacterium]
MSKTLYLLDGHYQIYRAFYAMRQPLTSPAGEPTAATHVFCSMLFGLIRDRRPDYLAMLMDVSDETVFRRELDVNYKAHRDPPPEELDVQADRIVAIVSALGIPIYRQPGFEADDLMATITHKLREQDVEIFMVSRDKDLEQLLSDRVRLFDPTKGAVLDPATLLETKGYRPDQAVEVQTLVGDSTDNIPGVHGVGTKTATKLIQKYGSADAVLEHADELTPKMNERVKAYAEQLPVTRQLVTLRRDVSVSFDLSSCAIERLNVAAARPIFEELGFTRLTERLNELGSSLDAPFGDSSQSSGTLVDPPARGPEPDRRYEVVDTPEALQQLADRLARQSCFAFDTETTGLNPVASGLVGLSFSWKAGEAYYVPVQAAVGDVLPLASVVEKLRPVFEDASIEKVGHNLKYDLVVVRQVGIEVAGVSFDTLLASFILDPTRRSHSLDNLVRELLGHEMIPISELIGKGNKQISLDQLDTQRVGEYAAEDADFTWRLKELLEPQLAGSDTESLFRETEMRVVEVLAEMEHNGIALDVALLSELGTSLAQRLEELTAKIHEAAGRPFNIDSPKQLAEVLFDELGFEVVRKTKTGRSTDAETLETLAAGGDHVMPRLVLEYRELAKLKSTYVDKLPKMVCARTGRIHASFHLTGAVTGRLSSSDPNLQNIPIRTDAGRRIREAFVAGDPGSVLLAADYSQIELRLLAHFCQDPALVEAFQSGQDIHKTVAAQINGVAVDEVTSEQRSAAKAVNFGIIYGQSPFGLSRALGIPIGEARTFIDTYFMRYPGIRLFIDRCVDDARRTGYAQTILGRRRPIPELRSRNRGQVSFGERIAVNTVVQGSAADLIKRAMIDIHAEVKTNGYGAKMLIQVHDELVFEVPEKHVESAAEMIRRKMENPFKLTIPLVVDISWGRNWAEAH